MEPRDIFLWVSAVNVLIANKTLSINVTYAFPKLRYLLNILLLNMKGSPL